MNTRRGQTMGQEFFNFLNGLIPERGERIIMFFSGVVGAYLSWALGGIDYKIEWLFFFVVADYLTGMTAAYKLREWKSSTGFRGILKKVIIFVVVAVCHGLDTVTGMDILRNAAIIAYAVNESISILENIEKMGFSDAIPAPLKKALKTIKDKEDSLFDKGDNKNE